MPGFDTHADLADRKDAEKYFILIDAGKPTRHIRITALSLAKLALLSALQIVLKNALTLLGVSAPEEMRQEGE
jgi:hypothetical protein